jgi:hypothetical protein
MENKLSESDNNKLSDSDNNGSDNPREIIEENGPLHLLDTSIFIKSLSLEGLRSYFESLELRPDVFKTEREILELIRTRHRGITDEEIWEVLRADSKEKDVMVKLKYAAMGFDKKLGEVRRKLRQRRENAAALARTRQQHPFSVVQ